MKKLLLILALVFISCSADETTETQSEQTCYTIIARGVDGRGNYIIVKYADFVNKRYEVSNYQDYLNQSKICTPINLNEQPL